MVSIVSSEPSTEEMQSMPPRCPHLAEVRNVDPKTPAGCEECLATGGRWVHLRLCQECGHVGCCDNSPGRHAELRARRGLELVLRGRAVLRAGGAAGVTLAPGGLAGPPGAGSITEP